MGDGDYKNNFSIIRKVDTVINQISREKESSIEIKEVEFEKGVKIDD